MARGDRQIRIPNHLIVAAEAEADATNRSLTEVIVMRLEAAFHDGSTLSAEVDRVLRRQVEIEVQRRLKAIASQIGGA